MMTDADRSHLRALQAEVDAAGRAVAAVRVRGGSAAEMAEALAEMQAREQVATDYCRSLGFRIAGEG